MPKYPPTTGTTVAGLRGILDVLGNHVTDANRKGLEDIFARFHAGDTSMLVFVNLDDKEKIEEELNEASSSKKKKGKS
jgi:hypothetical protein